MSCGIAEAGMAWKAAEQPTPLPVQALDHATGYLMAASALRALDPSWQQGGQACLSLARTARLLIDHSSQGQASTGLRPEGPEDQRLVQEQTAWGPAHRLQVPLNISGTPLQWDCPAGPLGAHRARWW